MSINFKILVLIVAEKGCFMNIFTVSLFGHREIGDLRKLDAKITPIIKNLIRTKPYISFLIGRNGEFDEHVASVVKSAQNELGRENNEIILVLPYKVANLEYYDKYYDNIIIPEIIHGVHHKSVITLRNRWMIENSDLAVFYVEHDTGGAYKAMKYAEMLCKDVINIFEN